MKTVRLKKSGMLKRLSDMMAHLFVSNGAGTYAPKEQWKREVRDKQWKREVRDKND